MTRAEIILKIVEHLNETDTYASDYPNDHILIDGVLSYENLQFIAKCLAEETK